MTGRSNALDGTVAMREVCEPALVERFGIVLSMAVLERHFPTDNEARWRTELTSLPTQTAMRDHVVKHGEVRSPRSQSIDGNRHE